MLSARVTGMKGCCGGLQEMLLYSQRSLWFFPTQTGLVSLLRLFPLHATESYEPFWGPLALGRALG